MRCSCAGLRFRLSVSGLTWAQQAPNKESDRAELLQKLHSDKVDERDGAFEKLRADSSALQSTEAKAALIDLLDRENHVTFNDDQEGYVEYVSELIEAVTGLVIRTDSRLVDRQSPVRLACLLKRLSCSLPV